MKGSRIQKGYLQVCLCRDGEEIMQLVHRLVALAFLPNPNGLPQVNHKNECKTDNRVENLEWCTAKYNSNYGTRIERVTAKVTNTEQLLYGKSVAQFTPDGKEVTIFACINEAARQLGFSPGGISNVCNGKQKTYKGYIWKFYEPVEVAT